MAEAEAEKKQGHYLITEAIIFMPRYGGENQQYKIEVGNLISELQIFEDIRVPFLTGKILIVDKVRMFENVMFVGSEKIQITIYIKTFIMRALENVNPDRTVFAFDLIEDYGFASTIQTISRSFNGKLENIVAKLLKDYCGKSVEITKDKASIQPDLKVVVPNMTVAKAIQWLTKRMSSIKGAPYFIYSRLYSDTLRLTSLDNDLAQVPFNDLKPFVYAPNILSSETNPTDPLMEGFIITRADSHGSHYDVSDINSNDNLDVHVSAYDFYQKLKSEINRPTDTQNVFDPYFKVNDKLLRDYDSVYNHRLVSSSTFLDYPNFGFDGDTAQMKSCMNAQSLRTMMSANLISITTNGAPFFILEASVGQMVKLVFSVYDFSQNDKDSIYDAERSGNYFITNIRHVFSQQKHTVDIKCGKLNRQENIMTGETE